MTFDAIVLAIGLGVLLFGWIKRQRGAMFLGGAFAALAGALLGHDLWLAAKTPADFIEGAIVVGAFGYPAIVLLKLSFLNKQ